VTRHVIAWCGLAPWSFVAVAAFYGPRLWMMVVQACLSLVGLIGAIHMDYKHGFIEGRRA
jgi:hypothetical protein